MGLFEVASGKGRELLKAREGIIARARFSPDGGWASFHSRVGPRSRVFVVPVRDGPGAPSGPGDDEWIAVTSGESQDGFPHWSPDGQLLYFTSNRDGNLCLWAQRLNATTKQPVGAPMVVQHVTVQRFRKVPLS